MDAVSISSSTRLLEAFERMGASQGEGLVSSGPSPVPTELARTFEHLMEQAPSELQPTAESLPGQSPAVLSADVLPDSDLPKEVSAVDNTTGTEHAVTMPSDPPLMSPSELYRLQFQVAMLRLQADTGSQVSQKTTQGLDSLLRNQS